jgi:hypothetical protein
MGLDFTVVFSVRQRFGDNEHEEFDLETDAPFVGAEKDFPFQCPSVDPTQFAILLFQSQGVSVRNSPLEINGQLIFGGIPASIDRDSAETEPGVPQFGAFARWHGTVMLVHPGVLKANNILRISATGGDDFVVDNAVVVFKSSRFGLVTASRTLSAKRPKRSKKQKRQLKGRSKPRR